MNVMMIGDVVGPDAVAYLAEHLPELRREHDVDLVVANAENCAISGPIPRGGFGMTLGLVERLFAGGVDVITSGNHGWDGPEARAVHRHLKVLRPHNFPADAVGKGAVTLDVSGETACVLNLGSRSAAMPEALPVYESFVAAGLGGTIVVDFH